MYLKWQRFFYEADNGANTGGGTGVATQPAGDEPTKTETKPEPKTFTQEQLNKISARQKASYQRMAEKKAAAILKQQQEKQRLEGLPESERLKADYEKTKERLAKYEAEAATMRLERDLTAKGLPADLASIIPTSDAVKAKSAVETIAKFKESVETPLLEKIKGLEEQLKNAGLRGVTPKIPGGTKAAPQIPVIF